jgi:SAM-dependent methyltransferase
MVARNGQLQRLKAVTGMSSLRSLAPAFVKKIIWDRKYQNVTTNPDICPSDLLRHLASIDKNASVLDLGCGAGNLLAALRRRGWAGSFEGVDVSEQAIETGRNIGDANAQWHVSTIEDFKIPAAAAFDIISLCESLYTSSPTGSTGCSHNASPGSRPPARSMSALSMRTGTANMSSASRASVPRSIRRCSY